MKYFIQHSNASPAAMHSIFNAMGILVGDDAKRWFFDGYPPEGRNPPLMKKVPERFLRDALEVMEKAQWHIANPDASKAIPPEWDNSAVHIGNLLHVSRSRLKRNYPLGWNGDD